MTTENFRECLESLYRGELSACETYNKAIASVKESSTRMRLKEIQKDHLDAVSQLRSCLEKNGGKVPEDSGAWGAWAKTVTASATMMGDATTFKTLKEGEEHGVKEYRDAIVEEEIDFKTKSILQDFIPKQQKHIEALNRLIH